MLNFVKTLIMNGFSCLFAASAKQMLSNHMGSTFENFISEDIF